MPLVKRIPLQRIMITAIAALLLLLGNACVPLPPTPLDDITGQSLPATTATPESPPPANPLLQEILAIAVSHEASVNQEETIPAPAATAPNYTENFASYYAKRFNGRRTSSGERYNPDGMTAATRDFPLQSWLKVINPANGKDVTVRINDRTGKRKTPLIDLSRAAAKELGFLGKGKIHVHVILLPSPLLSDLSGE